MIVSLVAVFVYASEICLHIVGGGGGEIENVKVRKHIGLVYR